jgi:beta-mannosidase
MKMRNRIKTDLCGAWEFCCIDFKDDKNYKSAKELKDAGLKSYPCTVPGNFELDLYKNGLCPEPFYGQNPVTVRKMTENRAVYYHRAFDLPETGGKNPILVFEGLDCCAEIYINGKKAAYFDNMLIERKIELSGVDLDLNLNLKEKNNEILARIIPAIECAGHYDYPPSVFAMGSNMESLYIRKAPHMYGWDIMPRFLSAGIWRPAYIEYLPEERIDDVFLSAKNAGQSSADIEFLCDVKFKTGGGDKYKIGLKMSCGDSEIDLTYDLYFAGLKKSFRIQNPKLWFPKGSGGQNLYDVCVSLIKNGGVIDEYRLKYGVRTIELNRTSTTDQFGKGAFEFIINGVKIFMKGSNWVPADAFHSRDRERIPEMLKLAEDINCNMLRCWGGNVYEDDLFYELCDELGFLVWQDFAFACAVYPQDEDFCGRVREEAEAVVKRLRNHASLALWSGDNECDEAYFWNGAGDPNGNKITREILPEVIKRHDKNRPYIPSSPYLDKQVVDYGREYASEQHLWGPRDYYKSPFYINSICHFASEIGYHGCPSPESVKKFIEPSHLWGDIKNDEQWLLHSTSPVPELHLYDYRVELMSKQIAEVFDVSPDNLEDFPL